MLDNARHKKYFVTDLEELVLTLLNLRTKRTYIWKEGKVCVKFTVVKVNVGIENVFPF